MHPDLPIAGYHHGYFWDNEQRVVDEIASSGARLLFVAISSPRKEKFIHKWQRALGVQFVMGIGGALDVMAGRFSRAPVWMQDLGLEWFYRFAQEPRRLWRRYLIGNSAFILAVLKAKMKKA
jgi:N-acetylglucosaminyldiphosphoundecaprenol N-acetyl-beta-D-mannosaminyltransferase